MGRPPILPKKKKDGFYLEIRNKGAKTGTIIIRDTEEAMMQAVRQYQATKDIVILGEHRNGKKVEAELSDKFDALLKELGMDAGSAQKVGDLKAPMPGLVVDIPVKEGDVVKKGDTLVILEAMKMENALKAVGDAVVKKINVKKGQAVDKNTLLVQMA
jgi:biotin carboxyl carrier protein